MSNQMGDCCVSGHIHSGTPKGTVETIGGCKTYVAKASSGSKAQTVIFITDIFGYELPNVRLLADEYADNGFYVLIPDLFDGDSIPYDINLLKAVAPLRSDPEVSDQVKKERGSAVEANLYPWIGRHGEDVSKPIIEKFIAAVRADSGVSKIGSVGFCWGGHYTILLSSSNDYPHLDAGVANHPSMLKVPDEITLVNKPVLVQVGDSDGQMPIEQVKETQKLFAGKKDAEVIVYPGAVHGFTIRGDLNIEEEKEQKTSATEKAIKFLQKHLA